MGSIFILVLYLLKFNLKSEAGESFEASLGNIMRPCLKTKIKTPEFNLRSKVLSS
jgi:hypothetical protein